MSGPQEALWILIALLSAVSIAALSGYLWRRGGIRGARPLSCAMLVMTAWCLAYAAQLAAVDVETKKTWFLVGDLLTLPAAGVSLWFALEYAGLERLLTRPRVLALVGSMAILAAAYLVNGSSLIWSDLRFDGMVRGEMAPLGVIASAYIFALAVSATGIFVVLFVRSPAHRAPVVLILVGHVSLRVALALEALSLMPVPGVPIAVIALDVTALMYSVALFRFRMFDLLPDRTRHDHRADARRAPRPRRRGSDRGPQRGRATAARPAGSAAEAGTGDRHPRGLPRARRPDH